MTSTEPPKKTNIYDANALKIVLDDYTKAYLVERGFHEDTFLSNFKIVVGGFGMSPDSFALSLTL
jgi:hypothetical protein